MDTPPVQGKPQGKIRSFARMAFALLLSNWGLPLSAVLAAIFAVWKWSFDFAQRPEVITAGKLFLFFLWTYIGVRIVSSLNKAKPVRMVSTIAHSLIMDGFMPIYNKDSDLPLGFILNFRNLYHEPIRFELEELRVVLGDRIVPDSPHPPAMVIPRLAVKGIRTGGLSKEALGMGVQREGTFSISLLYGPFNQPYQRKFSFRTKIKVRILQDGMLEFGDEFVADSDVAI